MHYSRVSTPASQAYSAGTAVLMNEILKGAISFLFALARVDAAPAPPSPYLLDAPKARAQLVRSACSRLNRVARDVDVRVGSMGAGGNARYPGPGGRCASLRKPGRAEAKRCGVLG